MRRLSSTKKRRKSKKTKIEKKSEETKKRAVSYRAGVVVDLEA